MKILLLLLAIGLNRTYSPDSTRVAYTLDNDLYVEEVASGRQTRLTFDGSDVVMNGYASWVYYEEILGRGSRYKAFWWSPDSQRIGFYRFDDSEVPMFPIYSPFGQDGELRRTHYPKAGEKNPEVRIGIVTVADGKTVWADFDEKEDQYFGIPFWGKDSREFFIAREPRIQNRFDLYSVSVEDGSKKLIYHEEYKTWVEWIEQVIFTDKGLYMARNFETGWQQIYFLSYDGKTFRRLTEGENWDISLLKVDEKKGDIWFTAKRDSRIHPALYRLDRRGRITALTDPDYYLSGVRLSEDGRTFTGSQSTAAVPTQLIKGRTDRFQVEVTEDFAARYDLDTLPSPQPLVIRNDGYDLYGLVSYPRGFDPSRRYPVLMQLYGGPGTPYVRDYWQSRDASDRWCFDNGIIYIVVDPRSSGENGRAGMDEAFRQMTVTELGDYIAWAKYLQAQPYVQGDRIGVEGFSFGGTTTAMLVLRYPEYFRCGVAGGGVYDWMLYDSHYTERFMETPQANPDGYALATVLNYVQPAADGAPRFARLKLTHGTGDDNVHFQNTLQLVDALQKACIQFELMIYPDGMHGYRGAQHEHDQVSDHDFWTRHLLR
ncbi:MAG: S9 family peptidase [Bacteroidales bacterium]|nr:S9 family peptidase [Bacteroidales bacterium]